MDKLESISAELGPKEEISEIIENPSDSKAYIGYEPSGHLHLGHMVTVNALQELQNAGVDITILIADLHAELNDKGSAGEMKSTGEIMEKQLLALGLSESTDFVYGSDFQFEEEYQRMVHRLSQNTTSNRARRAMSEISHGESENVSQLLYPVMQCADIWWLDADIAVGGMEQRKVHMLARDVFPEAGLEKPAFVHTPLIADLKDGNGKMSNSTGVSISSSDSSSEVSEKIMNAFCPKSREENGKENPVLQMYEYHVFPRYDSVTIRRPDKYGGDVSYSSYQDLQQDLVDGSLHPDDAKSTLSDKINEILNPVREVHR